MTKQELQELVTELKEICTALSSVEDEDLETFDILRRLNACMDNLKKDPLFADRADEIIYEVVRHMRDDTDLDCVVSETEKLISEIEIHCLLSSLKKGYDKAKDTVADAIPNEVKDTYKSTANTLHNVVHKTEKRLKSKIKNWLLSDDDDEE